MISSVYLQQFQTHPSYASSQMIGGWFRASLICLHSQSVYNDLFLFNKPQSRRMKCQICEMLSNTKGLYCSQSQRCLLRGLTPSERSLWQCSLFEVALKCLIMRVFYHSVWEDIGVKGCQAWADCVLLKHVISTSYITLDRPWVYKMSRLLYWITKRGAWNGMKGLVHVLLVFISCF